MPSRAALMRANYPPTSPPTTVPVVVPGPIPAGLSVTGCRRIRIGCLAEVVPLDFVVAGDHRRLQVVDRELPVAVNGDGAGDRGIPGSMSRPLPWFTEELVVHVAHRRPVEVDCCFDIHVVDNNRIYIRPFQGPDHRRHLSQIHKSQLAVQWTGQPGQFHLQIRVGSDEFTVEVLHDRELAFHVFTSCQDLASVFGKSRP